MAQPTTSGPSKMLYAVTIHHCIDEGDLQKMKALCSEAEQHLADHGDVKGALDKLKAEIAKLEKRGG